MHMYMYMCMHMHMLLQCDKLLLPVFGQSATLRKVGEKTFT